MRTGILLTLLFVCAEFSFALKYYTVEIISRIPHYKPLFTQGLTYSNNQLYESTGLYGDSAIKIINLKSANLIKKSFLDKTLFGEGMTISANELWQLTWKKQKVYIYDIVTLKLKRSIDFQGEGWGLTRSDKFFIRSNGSSFLFFHSLTDFKLVKKVRVKVENEPLKKINELEYVGDKIYANIWYENFIAIINPHAGKVEGIIKANKLTDTLRLRQRDSVLNGIAYDPVSNFFYLTGKNWPYIFKVKIVPL